MKKALIVFLYTSLHYGLMAQVAFCPTGASWNYIFRSGFPPFSSESETITYVGKLMLDGDSVKVLSHYRFFLQTNAGINFPTYIKQNGDTIFLRNARTQDTWQILYNFNVQQGDKWNNALYMGVLPSTLLVSYTTVVSSIQTITVNSSVLKQVSVIQTNNRGNPSVINFNYTERLGSNLFLFSFGGRYVSDGDMYIQNLCYSDSTFGSYQFSEKECDYVLLLGIDNQPRASGRLNIHPNPANSVLKMGLPEEVFVNEEYSFEITNALGQKIQKGELSFVDGKVELNIENLPPAVYTLSLSNSSGKKHLAVWRSFCKTE